MKVVVATRSGRELIKGGLQLGESVCGFVFFFLFLKWVGFTSLMPRFEMQICVLGFFFRVLLFVWSI